MPSVFFTDEHQMIRETVADFAKDKLDPLTEKMDSQDYFPLEVIYTFISPQDLLFELL